MNIQNYFINVAVEKNATYYIALLYYSDDCKKLSRVLRQIKAIKERTKLFDFGAIIIFTFIHLQYYS